MHAYVYAHVHKVTNQLGEKVKTMFVEYYIWCVIWFDRSCSNMWSRPGIGTWHEFEAQILCNCDCGPPPADGWLYMIDRYVRNGFQFEANYWDTWQQFVGRTNQKSKIGLILLFGYLANTQLSFVVSPVQWISSAFLQHTEKPLEFIILVCIPNLHMFAYLICTYSLFLLLNVFLSCHLYSMSMCLFSVDYVICDLLGPIHLHHHHQGTVMLN